MKIGIVGSEEAKFTPETQAKARAYIRLLLSDPRVTGAVSGECHLGGIDIWAREEAEALGVPFTPHPPATLNWSDGYKPRNLKIAQDSDVVVCITLKELPETYTSMRFPQGCYHCKTPPEHHIKSGGCWTMKQAEKMGKKGYLKVILP